MLHCVGSRAWYNEESCLQVLVKLTRSEIGRKEQILSKIGWFELWSKISSKVGFCGGNGALFDESTRLLLTGAIFIVLFEIFESVRVCKYWQERFDSITQRVMGR